MYTYQDLEKVLTEWKNSNTDTPLLQFVQGAIQSHKSDKKSLANYEMAVLADEYYRHRDRTIVEYQKLLYDISGHPKVDEWGANYKLSSNFLFMAVNQLNQYLLSNGVTWAKSTTAKRLGANFDAQAQKAGAEALKGGVSFGFVNYDHVEVFSLTEFVPFKDEITNQLMAGIRFWQLASDKPLRATLYIMDGVIEMVWGEREDNRGRILKPLTPYITVTKGAPADAEKIYDGENYPTFPIVPFYGINKQSELLGRQEKIDCYDLLFSGFANTVDEAAFIYWAIEGAGGMKDMDLSKFTERMKRLHAAAVGDEQRVTANAVEAPYASREAILQRLRDDIYEDFMMVDTASIKSGSVVTAQIEAAFHNLDMKANLFEFCILDWLEGICKVLGIEGEEPTLTRSKIINTQEQVSTLTAAAEYLTEDYITRKILQILGDGDKADDIIKERTAEDLERIKVPQEPPQNNPQENNEEGEEWTEGTNEQNRS